MKTDADFFCLGIIVSYRIRVIVTHRGLNYRLFSEFLAIINNIFNDRFLTRADGCENIIYTVFRYVDIFVLVCWLRK